MLWKRKAHDATDPPPSRRPRQLNRQLSAAFLAILLCFSVLLVAVTVSTISKISDQVAQVQSWMLAERFATELRPYLGESIDHHSVANLVLRFHDLHPGTAVFFLDPRGNVLEMSPREGGLRNRSIPVAPLEQFLKTTSWNPGPVYGAHPLQKRATVFSVTRIPLGSTQGYLYLTLRTNPVQALSAFLLENAAIQQGIAALLGAIVLSAFVGLLLLAKLTRPFYQVLEVVRHFQRQDFNPRANVRVNNEIKELAKAVNSMADTIVENLHQLEEKDRIRRELIANVSHDLRAPVASIRALSEGVLERYARLAADQVEECLQGILGSVRSLQELVQELFDLSRFEAGEIRLHAEYFSLLTLAKSLRSKFIGQARSAGIELEVVHTQDPPLVLADPGLIDRALSNLINNALRHTPAGGSVAVTFMPQGDHVLVDVRDTGCGIPAEEFSSIFDRFYRVRTHAQQQGGGSGLGLAIVKQIVELHGSEIAVQSTIGEGTVFRFTLPTASYESEDLP